MNKPLAIDLYAGVGGLSLGIQAAGFQMLGAFEIEPRAAMVYAHNFPGVWVLPRDVSTITRTTFSELGRPVDLVVGGPPCQGFSRIGKRDPNDPRNQQVNEFCRVVTELRPRAFVMENVLGLRDYRHSDRIDTCYRQLVEAGYKVAEWRLNALDFGVPQERIRLFWVGSLDKDLGYPLENPETTRLTTVSHAISDLCCLEPQLTPDVDAITMPPDKPIGYLQKQLDWIFPTNTHAASGTLTGCARTIHSDIVRERFARTQPGTQERVSRFHRLAWEGFCQTLRAGTAGDRGGHTAARPIHPEFPRVITVREAARLQSFPDWFQFDPTKWHGYRQVGNAVPPLLAYAVGKEVMKLLS